LVYTEKKQSLDRTSSLTESERKIFDQQKVFISKALVSNVEVINQKPTILSKFMESFWTELVSLLLLFLSIVMLCIQGGTNYSSKTVAIQILILTWFNIEVCIKLFTLSISKVLSDGLNVVDILCTSAADILLILYFTMGFRANFMIPILVKFFGIGRALRRVLKMETKFSKSMKSLFDALIISFIHILPMLVIVAIALFGFAISAMNLMYMIPYQDEINHAFNFQTISSSYVSILK
jgi:hypothetical protein